MIDFRETIVLYSYDRITTKKDCIYNLLLAFGNTSRNQYCSCCSFSQTAIFLLLKQRSILAMTDYWQQTPTEQFLATIAITHHTITDLQQPVYKRGEHLVC